MAYSLTSQHVFDDHKTFKVTRLKDCWKIEQFIRGVKHSEVKEASSYRVSETCFVFEDEVLALEVRSHAKKMTKEDLEKIFVRLTELVVEIGEEESYISFSNSVDGVGIYFSEIRSKEYYTGKLKKLDKEVSKLENKISKEMKRHTKESWTEIAGTWSELWEYTKA
jgi:hypothetical protein